MLFALIGLWTIGLLLIATDPKRAATRWSSGITFTGGSGALAALIGERWRPYWTNQGWLSADQAEWLWRAERLCSFVCYYGLPYTFLMFAIVYSPGYAEWRGKRWLPWALLVPVLVSFLFEPAGNAPIPYQYVIWWAPAYIAAGIVLLVSAVWKEKNSYFRRSRLLTSMAAAPPLVVALFTLYLLPAWLDDYDWWRYNTWIIAFTVAVVVVSSFRYGFLGLQISIQNQRLDYTLRAITSGTAILNHAIKNDVGKIRLFGEKVKAEAAAGRLDIGQLSADMEIILQASRHIDEMVRRIQGQTQDMALHTETVRLSELLAQNVRMLAPGLGAAVEVKEKYATEGIVRGDPVQLAEVFTNVITNAFEAMPDGGTLTVRLTETKRKIVVEFKDTGTGMDKKQLRRAFDPFYTTKAGKNMNFGLGLSYCYNTIQKHKGSMSMHSKPGQGTSVFIQFPKLKRAARTGGESVG